MRSLAILVLLPILLLAGDRWTAEAVAAAQPPSTSPRSPLPIETLLNPFANPANPLTQTVRDIQSIPDPIPTSGSQPLLVILVDFDSPEGSFTLQEWEQYFFGQGGFSDYFYEISHGRLRYSGAVVGQLNHSATIDETAIAYVRLPHPIWYYAAGNYGFGSNFPFNNSGVVFDALNLLDATGFDFLPYADALSGKVENLVVIFAGSNYGYIGDPNYSLEATALSLSQGGMVGGFVSSQGIILDNFTFCPEKFGATAGEIAHLGICVHEHGHALGMFDLYDRSYEVTGTGKFDLMAYGGIGAYNDGIRPFHPGAFTKEFFGWSEPSIYLSGYQQVLLNPAEYSTDIIKIYPRGRTDLGEYFLLENRQPIGFDGDWQAANLCPGLLIWHIDEGIAQGYASVNRVNSRGPEPDYPPHPGVIVTEADGRYDMINGLNLGECSDTWQVGSTWDDLSVPAARLWDRSSSRVSVTVLDQIGSSLLLAIEIFDPQFSFQMYLPAIEK